ncbi:MAG: hypothetical protein ACM3WP_22745 [Acidobacteriota bacterium]
MYTITDLGTLPTGVSSNATGINNLGQVTGSADIFTGFYYPGRAFLWTQRTGMQDLGLLPCLDFCWDNYEMYFSSVATGVNDLGIVSGWSWINPINDSAFIWSPEQGMLDLGTIAGKYTMHAEALNRFGQVAGTAYQGPGGLGPAIAFTWTSAGGSQSLGSLPGAEYSYALDINDLGQIVGSAEIPSYCRCQYHAFSWKKNTGMQDLGTLGGTGSESGATAINAFGQVVGWSEGHAFRSAANTPINAATDDLGPGTATDIDDYGQVVGRLVDGTSALYSNGQWHDLNNLISPGSTCDSVWVVAINDAGQMAANANCNGQSHAVRLDPIYRGVVQQPINADGSSVLNAHRGVVPLKFVVTQSGYQSCTLPASIAVTRASAGTLAALDESTYSMSADNGSLFRIDPNACQYVYNLAASSLGVGTYRVDISINGIMVGHAVFALK